MMCIDCYWCQLCGFHNDVKCYNPESRHYKKKVYCDDGCEYGESEQDIKKCEKFWI